ncbi:hypothetical protein PIB30_085022, partial [Stylosanthes scabra]|nr:hypothetical protein [Stylosanthes scabra]
MKIWYIYKNDEVKYYMNDGLGWLNRLWLTLTGRSPRWFKRSFPCVVELDVKDTYEIGLYYGYGAICTERRTVVKPIRSIGHRIMSGCG